VTRVMPQTAADSWQLRNAVVDRAHGKGDFSPVFKLKLARKDPARGGVAAEPGTAERLRQGRARLVRSGTRRRP
jgi:3-hydroxyisobutyrate dehydrogenase-like beta-hydroxyacid dehydrogenase